MFHQNTLSILLSALFITIYASFDYNYLDTDLSQVPLDSPTSQYAPTTNSAFEGQICNVNKFPVSGDEPQLFYMCKTPVNDAAVWPWKQIGVWTKMRCKYGKWFSPESRMCRHVNSVRRMQQSYCATYPAQCQPIAPPQPIYVEPQIQSSCASPPCYPQPQVSSCPEPPCQTYVPPPPPPPAPVFPVSSCATPPCETYVPQPIPVPVAPSCAQPPCQPACLPEQPSCPQPVVARPCPMAGSGRCSWMLEKLKPAGQGYMQCVPSMPGQYCGRWLQRPCAPGTRFDGRLQVCVHDERGGGCAAPQIPIGPCNVQRQCPGQAVCQQPSNVCCQSGFGG